MRLLVSADIHLGSPIRSVALRNPELGARLKQASRDAFAKIIDLAIAEKVDALILAGDIFDRDHPELRARAFLIAQLARAAEAGVPTVLIRGNHDALLDHQAHGELGPNIHLLHRAVPTVEIKGTAFHGLSFESSHMSESLLPGYPPPVSGKRNVGLMHTSLDGAPGHDPYAPCAERDLMAHGYDLWCLGHIHAPFERAEGDVLAVMPGIPQPRHFGERRGGTVALMTLGEEGPPQIERREVAVLAFAECEVDLTEAEDQQAVLRALQEGMKAARVSGQDTALRLRVITDEISSEMLAELAAEVLENVEGVYLDKVKSVPSPTDEGAQADVLTRLMREELAEEGFRHASMKELQDLQGVLPAEIADELEAGELDALLEEAIGEVALLLHGDAVK
ncbi:DNA repair exonuclease [Alphaproteobacteria bacterium KMM 3653]|uniref:DNA repair exonuclease n=1 Tax=Harenicola maris TaxID=2841044 RepID=A0AAP2G6V3_9RHOB|nr:DNA repair exonuclease [Harenicola maris]